LQTSSPDTSLLRLPLARRFLLCSLRLPPPLTAGAGPRAPPPAAAHVHASSPLDPDLISLPWWPCAHAPRRPEPSPAATSSSPWIAPCRALTSSLSHAAAPLQHLRAVLLLPSLNFEHPSHISPPPSSSAPAAHGTPVGSPHQLTPTPINTCTSFLVTCSCSTTNCSPPISTRTSSPTKHRRHHLRPHRGQLALSLSTPPRYPSQHHIIPVKLPDPSSDSLVHHYASPTLAGVLPRRRRLCLRRSPLIQHVFFQLMVPTRSPCLTEAHAQVGCRCSPPELRRRR
jgi:hypothetical protein